MILFDGNKPIDFIPIKYDLEMKFRDIKQIIYLKNQIGFNVKHKELLLKIPHNFFYCEKKITIGINMMNLFKLIKTMNNNDTLTLFVEKDNQNKLGIKINNIEKNTKTLFKMNLLDILLNSKPN